MAAELFAGKWKLDTSENFDKYMKAVGVNALMAKIGSSTKPTVIITVSDDGQWNIRTETTIKSSDCIFRLNEEFDEVTTDGRKCRSTFTLEGDRKLVQDQKSQDEKGVPSIITREIQADNTLVTVCKAKDIVSTRVYKKA